MKLYIITFALFLLTSIGVNAANPGWTVNPYSFQYSMTATGVLIIDRMESTDTSDIIGAFVGSECRGTAKPMYISALGRYIAFLMIYSNTASGENISFKMYNSSDNSVISAMQIISFVPNNTIGLVANPYIWSNTGLSTNAAILSFSVPQQLSPSVIDTSARTIQVTVPQGTNVTALTASFTLSQYATAKVGSTIQQSGITANNFTAENSSYTKNWNVTVYYCESVSTATVGGTQSYCAALISTGLGGNTPLVGTGAWSIISGGTGRFSAPANGNSNFIANAFGTYVLRWTISNGSCTPSSADIAVNFYQTPTTATVGASQNRCAILLSGVLGGNTPAVGSGTWSIVSGGSGTFSATNSGNSTFTADNTGTYILRWTISNGTCTPSTADVTVNFYQLIAANAGIDQNLCNASLAFLNGNAPSRGSGSWSFISGPNTPAVSPVPGAAAAATGLISGITPYIFRYTITNGNCISTDDLIVTNYKQPTAAFAGTDQSICSSLPASITMAGNSPVNGTGTWTKDSGPAASFTSPSNPVTTVTGLSAGSYIFRWTISNGACQSSSDLVAISVGTPAIVNAGADQTICERNTATLYAAASGYTSLLWTSSGTGSFNSSTILNPVYTPSAGDIVNGSAILTLTASQGSICSPVSDALTLTIHKQSAANAGSDAAVCDGSSFNLATASVIQATSILWTTTGTGTFSNATVINPVYTPGSGDLMNGHVRLILSAGSASSCSTSADTMLLTINTRPLPAVTGNLNVNAGSREIYNTAGASGNIYLWSVTGGTLISGQNTSSVMVAWDSCATCTEGSVSVIETTPQGCSASSTVLIAINFNPGRYRLSGQLTYDNATDTPLNGVDIQLIMDGHVVATTSTTTNNGKALSGNPVPGYYEFNNLSYGNYSLNVSSTKPWGGVTATDALLINLHTVGIITVTGLPLVAANVNLSPTVNATDALIVQLRIVGILNQFTAGNWIFNNDSFAFNASNTTYNFKGICIGDVINHTLQQT